MKLSFVRLAPFLLLPLWLGFSDFAQGSAPTSSNSGNPPCGNDVPPSEDPKCNECGEEGEGPEFTEPCPSTTNPVHSYNGNAQHIIPDLKIAGSVGRLPLEFTRYSATRTSNRNLVSSSFGKESSWSHNFDWLMRDSGGTFARPRITVTFPQGRELTFVKPENGGSVWFSTLNSRTERISVTATDYTFIDAKLSQYRFVKRLNSAGLSFYRLESYSDKEGNTYNVGYSSLTDTLIRQVTDPAGRWIKMHYNDMATSTNAVTPLATSALSGANVNNWLEIPVSSGTAFRYLALNQGNTWQQQNTLPVGELEFYDENNVKITGGTPFGSTPLFSPTLVPANAFDGDLATVYRYAYVKAGFVGIDLGPGAAKKVSKIRLYVTGVGATTSVNFVGFNADPIPNQVISHVEGSDGRTVSYDYSTFSDASGWFQWAQLTGANYPDGTSSAYTYTQLHDYTAPIIQSLEDPRFEGTAKNVNYELTLTNIMGFVTREFDSDSGQEIGRIGWDSGHEPKIIYPNGKINVFKYSSGRITEKVDSFGFKSTYTYGWGGTGTLASATDPLGRTTSYTYAGYGRLASTTYPSGLVETITRSSSGHVMSTNRGGEITSHLRDAANRITRTNHPDGSYETWTFNSFGQELTHRLRNGATESWTYTVGLKTSHTDALGKITTYTYDSLDRLATVTTPLGHTTAYLYNDRGDITQTTYPDGGVEINTYDTSGNRIARLDAEGGLWQYEYDSHSRKTKETDPLNRFTLWNFGATGTGCGSCNNTSSPYSITHPDGTVTAYTYDKEWRLLTETRAAGTALAATTTHTYDAAGQRVTSTDPLGRITTYTYDSMGRIASMTDPLGGVTSRTYDVKGNLLTETAPDGVITSRTYGTMGRVLTQTRASGTAIAQTTTFTYDSAGRRVTSKDALNRTTTLGYDALDRTTTVTLADGNHTQQTYDDAGRMTSSRDLGGHITLYTHDAMDRVLTSTDATGVTLTRTYDFLGRVLTVTTPTGKSVATTYDPVGNVLATTTAPGTTEQTTSTATYDAMDRPLTRTDGAGSTTTMTYDVLGRTLTSKDHLNHLTAYTYDLVGNLLTIRAPDGVFTSTRTYDALNRPLTDRDGKNQTITSAYDSVGRKTSYTDAKGATFSFQFDALSRLTRRTEPDGTYQTYTHDAANRLLVHRKADNATKTHHYENANRDFLTKITYSNGETPRTFTYDAEGQMLTASNAHAAVTRSYDAAHRQLSETQTLSGLPGSHTFTYQYDTDGNLTRHTRPDGSFIDYAWNARNLLASVTSDAPPPLATYSYNARNQIASTVVETGLFTATRSYDTAGRLTGVSNGSLDTTAYTLSADGRRTGIERNGQAETYGYDAARQVTSANYGGLATTQSWNYDNAGNRSSATTNGATTTYLANTVNEYTTITGSPAPPMYDANGNAISYPVKPLGSPSLVSGIFTWDINNQQITATVGSDSATYQYDALGRRTKRTETIASLSTTTYFLTNGWNVELEHDGTAYTTRQTWGLDLSQSLQGAGGVGGLVMVETLPTGGGAPVPSFPTYDGNGNITAWVSASGTVTARQRYDTFGNIVDQTGTAPSNYGFSTKPIEKVTGFHYYGYRYYDSVSGRWPSRDPIEEEGGENLYGFVGNDGVNGLDVYGLRRLPGSGDNLGRFGDQPCKDQCCPNDHDCLAACRDARLRMGSRTGSPNDPDDDFGGGGGFGNPFLNHQRGAGFGFQGNVGGRGSSMIGGRGHQIPGSSNVSYGELLGALGDSLAGFSDGVLLGQGHNLAKWAYGPNTTWGDTSSGFYTGGVVTGIAATTVAVGVGWTRGGEALARNGWFQLSRHVATETTSQYFTRALLPATRTYSESLTRSLFTGANRSLTRGRGTWDLLTTRSYSNGSAIVVRNILNNKIIHYNPYKGF